MEKREHGMFLTILVPYYLVNITKYSMLLNLNIHFQNINIVVIFDYLIVVDNVIKTILCDFSYTKSN